MYRYQNHFIHYYVSQAGVGLLGFCGVPTMYGRGIGAILARIFLFVRPLLKKGFSITKLNQSKVARRITSGVMGKTFSSMTQKRGQEEPQEGGRIMVSSQKC